MSMTKKTLPPYDKEWGYACIQAAEKHYLKKDCIHRRGYVVGLYHRYYECLLHPGYDCYDSYSDHADPLKCKKYAKE